MLRKILFVLIVLALVSLTSAYVFRRGARILRLKKRGRVGLAVLLSVAPLAMIASRFLEGIGHEGAAFVLGSGGGTLVLGVLISAFLLVLIDAPFGALAWVRRWRLAKRHDAAREAAEAAQVKRMLAGEGIEPADALPPEAQQVKVMLAGDGADPALTADALEHETEGALVGPRTVGRRELVRTTATGAALSLGFGSAFYGALFGRHDYQVPEVPVSIPGLSPHLDGYRIAQLSDIHFGVYVGEAELRRAVSLVRDARPDLVVLTGDLLDHDARFAPVLGKLVRALSELPVRDGVTVIPGNHDYYAGVDAVLGTAREAGARVLKNTGRLIGDAGGAFALVGVDDVWAPRNGYGGGPDLQAALRTVPDDVPRVLLCHNPAFFPAARGHVALQLSGHTHGGQVNLGVHPAELLLPYVEGLYREEGSHLYVNRGFGTAGPPARVGAPPEVTLVVLTAA